MASKKEKEKKASRQTSARDWAQNQQKGFEPTCVMLPEGTEFYKLTPGIHKLDFLPYKVGEHNPRADEGMLHFERSYEAHRIPTADGSVRLYLCRAKCLGGAKCGGCEWLRKNGGSADPEVVKSLRCTSRHLWLVNDKPGDKKNKLKVLDTNHFNRGLGFGEQMAEAINSLEEGVEPFCLTGGYTATLTVKEQTFPGGKYNACTRIDLRPHSYDYPESILDDAPCLDECLVDPGFDSVMEMLEGGELRDEKPSRNGEAKSKDDDDEEEPEKPSDTEDEEEDSDCPYKVGDEVEHEGKVCEVTKVSDDGTSLTLKEAKGGKVHRGIDPSDVEPADPEEEDEEEDEEEEPVAKKGKKKPAAKDDDEDDEPDEGEDSDLEDDSDGDSSDLEDDDEPPAKGKKKK